MDVRVSLVLPAYNEEAFIGACLDAVAAQTVMPDEVIVVDNNSTDRTVEIVKKYPFVKLLREKRQGLRFTRNTGMDAATGDVIGRVDTDSILSPTWCEEIHRLFADPAVQAATGPCYYYDMPAPQLSLTADRLMRRLSFSVSGPLLYGSNMVLRRPVWQAIRGTVCMEGVFFEDYDLTIHLREAGYKVTYDQKLVVGVAARVLDSTPLDFYQNMQHHTKTFRLHGKRNATASINKYMLLTSYPFLKTIRQAYDPNKDALSVRHYVRKRARARRPSSNT